MTAGDEVRPRISLDRNHELQAALALHMCLDSSEQAAFPVKVILALLQDHEEQAAQLATVTAERDAARALSRKYGIHKWWDEYTCQECCGGWREGEPEYHRLPCPFALSTPEAPHG